jgi:hypothetical protein
MIGQHIREALAPIVFLVAVVGLLAIALGLTDCKPAVIPAEDIPSYCYDEDLLRAKVFACVASAETRAESQACRKQSLKACGIEVYP